MSFTFLTLIFHGSSTHKPVYYILYENDLPNTLMMLLSILPSVPASPPLPRRQIVSLMPLIMQPCTKNFTWQQGCTPICVTLSHPRNAPTRCRFREPALHFTSSIFPTQWSVALSNLLQTYRYNSLPSPNSILLRSLERAQQKTGDREWSFNNGDSFEHDIDTSTTSLSIAQSQ